MQEKHVSLLNFQCTCILRFCFFENNFQERCRRVHNCWRMLAIVGVGTYDLLDKNKLKNGLGKQEMVMFISRLYTSR